ncbi:MAG: CCDC90 family protein [Magnetococcus sp. YQC-9]
MTAITFDTLKYVKTLKAAGFEERQAEALAAVQADVLDKNLDVLATRGDLKELEIRLDARLKELELRMAAEMAPLKWGTAITVGGIVAIILKTFFPH